MPNDKPKKKDVARKVGGKIVCGSALETELLNAGVGKQQLAQVLRVFKSGASGAAGSPSGGSVRASS